VTNSAASLARTLGDLERRLVALERTSSLGFSSITGSALSIYDEDGTLRGSLGVLADGTVGLEAVAGPVPPAPSTPSAVGSAGGLVISWDGLFVHDAERPGDFERVEVHVSTTSDFVPESSTFVKNLYGAASTSLLFGDTTPRFVRLVAYSTSGEVSAPSGQVVATPVAVVSSDDIAAMTSDVDLAKTNAASALTAANSATALASNIGPTQITDNAIQTRHVTAGSITTGKVAAGAIDADKIAASSIDASKIVASSITGDRLSGLTITGDKVAANAIVAGKIAAGAVTSSTIAANAITADKVSLGVTSSNLLQNAGFEDVGVYPAVPGTYTSGIPGWTLANANVEWAVNTNATALSGNAKANIFAGGSLTSSAIPLPASTNVSLGGYFFGTGYGRLRIESAPSATGPWTPHTFFDLEDIEPGASPGSVTEVRLAGGFATPVGSTHVRVTVANFDTGGTLRVDSLSMTRMGTGAAELSGVGLRLFDANGEETVSLVGSPGTLGNYLSIGSATGGSANVDSTGRVSGTQGAFDSLEVNGREFDAWLDSRALGVIARGRRTTSSTQDATETPYLEVQTRVRAGRLYRLSTNSFYLDNSVAGNRSQALLRIATGGAQVGTSSTHLQTTRVVPAIAAVGETTHLAVYYEAPANTELRVLLSYRADGGTGLARIPASATVPCELVVEDCGPAIANTGIERSGAVSNVVSSSYVTTWTGNFSGSYTGTGALNSFYGQDEMVQGFFSSTNGNQRGLVGFTAANSTGGQTNLALTTALTGAAVSKVEVYLYANHWYNSAGGTAVLGYHSNTSQPASWPSTALTNQRQVSGWGRAVGKWVDLGNPTFTMGGVSATLGEHLAAGRVRGITVGPGPTTGAEFYGRYNGATATSYKPQLRVSYTK
jgi:hypothetical protein